MADGDIDNSEDEYEEDETEVHVEAEKWMRKLNREPPEAFLKVPPEEIPGLLGVFACNSPSTMMLLLPVKEEINQMVGRDIFSETVQHVADAMVSVLLEAINTPEFDIYRELVVKDLRVMQNLNFFPPGFWDTYQTPFGADILEECLAEALEPAKTE